MNFTRWFNFFVIMRLNESNFARLLRKKMFFKVILQESYSGIVVANKTNILCIFCVFIFILTQLTIINQYFYALN